MQPFVVERFGDAHDPSGFDSGNAELDRWLLAAAWDSDGRNLTRTWVWHVGDGAVVGYYAITPCTLDRQGLPPRQSRGLPTRIPAYLVAKLALDRRRHGEGLGSHLLMSALERIAEGSDDLGGRYAVVDAIDDSAASFYLHHGFEPLPGVATRLVRPIKDIRAALERHRR